MNIKFMLLATASVSLVFAGEAGAQTGSAPASAPAQTAAKTKNANKAEVTEIIVTAERRAVKLQKIPLAVTVVGSDTLARENIDSASKLQNVVPGLKIFEVGVQPSIFIRGIGGPVANVLNDPAAAYNVDGVAVSRPISINGLFFDLERAEVLKGPQGTLYGGNSTVGAINIISHRPEFDYGGSAGVTIGNYGTIKTDGVLNVPFNDILAARVSFETDNHSGYLTNGSNDAADVGVRGKVLFEPSQDFEALTTATYFHSGGVGPGDVPLKSPSGSYLVPSNPWYLGTGPDLDNGGLVVPNNGFQDLTSVTVNTQLKLRTAIGTFSVTPSYIDTDYRALAYDGGFSKLYDSADQETGVEARLASNDTSTSRLIWTVGGIFQNVHQVSTVLQHINGVPPGPELYQQLPLNLTTKSYGLFGQATYSLTRHFRLTGGIRYTNDNKVVTGLNNTIFGAPSGPVVSSFPDSGNATFDNVDYRVGFDWDVLKSSLLYGNISTGYKTGGINPGLAPNTYKPEHLTAYQIGMKNTLLDHRLTFNFESWYWDYRDFQVQQFIPLNTPTGTSPGFGTTNAAKAQNYGVEATLNFQLTPTDLLTANVQYDVAKYVNFIQTSIFPVPSTVNYAGQTVPFAPVFSGTFSYQHIFELGDDTQLIPSVNDQYIGPTLVTLQAFPGQHVGSTNVTDLQLTLRLHGRYEIGAYVDNVQNAPVLLFAGATPAGVWGHPGAPRTYGFRATAKF